MDEPTFDTTVVIEEKRDGYTRYRSLLTGRRWEVFGYCDRRGDCLIGMDLDGFGMIENHDDIKRACEVLGTDRLVSQIDVPVTPEFKDCCPFTFNELEPGEV